jgi:hypothetical protein
MAFTEYTGDTTIIGALGTNPAERGLTTQEFKDKFDQFAKEFVAWFNATHVVEADAHLADKAQHISGNAACRVYHDVAQSCANDSNTVLAFNSERYDTDTIHDITTNNSRLTCKTAGKYNIFAGIEFAANATGFRQVSLLLNGTYQIAVSNTNALSLSITPTRINVSTVFDLAVNDYVEVEVYHTAGVAIDVNSSTGYSPEFGMVKVG